MNEIYIKERSAGQKAVYKKAKGEKRVREMERAMCGLKGKRRPKKWNQQNRFGGLREKSRGNSSTFTHIPRCVVGKT